MRRRMPFFDRDDDGAALIMVLGVVLLVGVITAALLGYITTTVRGRVPLDTVRNRQYAADGSVEYAIERVRLLASPSSSACAGVAGHYEHSLNGFDIRVDCLNVPGIVAGGGFFLNQRNVVFTSCVNDHVGTICSDANHNVIVRAQVNYEAPEVSPGDPIVITRTYVQSWSVNQ